MNESMLTGESVPVMKSALPMSDFNEDDHQDNYDTERHKRHTLFSGKPRTSVDMDWNMTYV